MKTSQTKTTNSILEDVLTEVDEARTLLSTIMRNSPDDEKTDSTLACLIRSLERTLQTGYEFIDNSPAPPSGIAMILPMIFFMPQSALQNSGNWLTYITNHIFQEKTVTMLIA